MPANNWKFDNSFYTDKRRKKSKPNTSDTNNSQFFNKISLISKDFIFTFPIYAFKLSLTFAKINTTRVDVILDRRGSITNSGSVSSIIKDIITTPGHNDNQLKAQKASIKGHNFAKKIRRSDDPEFFHHRCSECIFLEPTARIKLINGGPNPPPPNKRKKAIIDNPNPPFLALMNLITQIINKIDKNIVKIPEIR